MSAKQKNKVLVVSCVLFFLAGLASVAIGEGQASILRRVQTIEDPELGQLIRLAIENSPDVKMLDDYRLGRLRMTSEEYQTLANTVEAARPKIVRSVTETYAQIKLLDTQIEQLERKVLSSRATESVQTELLLAKAELEAKRTTELAKLREVMNVVPEHAFSRIPVKDLKSWLVLEAIDDDIVHVFKKSPRGFIERERFMYYNVESVKVMPEREIISYLRSFLRSEENQPIRIAICRNDAGLKSSEELYKQIVEMAEREKLQTQVDVYLDPRIQTGSQLSAYLRQGKIYWGKLISERKIPDEGKQEKDFYEENLPRFFNTPNYLPLKLTINFDEENKDMALRMEKAVKEAAKKSGVEHLVEVIQEQAGPDETK
jgi:5-bromo-4-chloroindolyl phosphate hydrolysis protein